MVDGSRAQVLEVSDVEAFGLERHKMRSERSGVT